MIVSDEPMWLQFMERLWQKLSISWNAFHETDSRLTPFTNV